MEGRAGRRSRSGNEDEDANDADSSRRQNVSEKEADPFLIDRSLDHPENPRNWSLGKKWYVVGLTCFMEFAISYASSAYSSGESGIAEELGMSMEVTLLGITTFVFGLGLGALFFAPVSEQFGRNWSYTRTLVSFVLLPRSQRETRWDG